MTVFRHLDGSAPNREPDAPCLLDGERNFLCKLCRRCGYWRMFRTTMPRYRYCDEPTNKG